jgi:predicted ribosomally synthesized peptide with SipW-like signal peptide
MQAIAARLVDLANLRVLLGLVLVVGALSAQSGRGTLAFFTSSATATSSFVAGSLDLRLTDADQAALKAVTASITPASATLKPGAAATSRGWITVNNTAAGSVPMNYGLTYTATDSGTNPNTGTAATLTGFLQLQVYSGVTPANCTAGSLAGGTSLFGPTGLTLTANTAIIPAASRALAASSSETLCFIVTFPDSGTAGTENAAQGGTSDITFTFTGQQQ